MVIQHEFLTKMTAFLTVRRCLLFFVTLQLVTSQQRGYHQEFQDLGLQIRQEGEGAASAIKAGAYEGDKDALGLRDQANEYAKDLNDVIYQLQRLVQSSYYDDRHVPDKQERETLKDLEESARRLAEYAYSVEQKVNENPNSLRNQLRSSTRNVGIEAERLSQLGQEQSQSVASLVAQLRDILNALLYANQRLRIAASLPNRSPQEIVAKFQLAVTGLSSAIQGINVDDREVARKLRHLTQQLCEDISRINDRLQQYLKIYKQGQDLNVFSTIRQISNKLTETHGNLLLAITVSTTQEDIPRQNDKFRNQIKVNVHNAAVQVQRLVQLTVQYVKKDNEDLKLLVHSCLADAFASAKNLDRKFSHLSQKNQ